MEKNTHKTSQGPVNKQKTIKSIIIIKTYYYDTSLSMKPSRQIDICSPDGAAFWDPKLNNSVSPPNFQLKDKPSRNVDLESLTCESLFAFLFLYGCLAP